jgi:hypothetical protein
VSLLSDLPLQLRLAGALLLCVGASHVVLPRAMGWKAELQAVSLMTRQVSYVHTYFIGLMCALFGLAATCLPHDLLARDPLAAPLLAAAVVVWGSRLVVQLFVFDAALWRGRAFTVAGHVAFVALWTYQTLVFSWALWRHL